MKAVIDARAGRGGNAVASIGDIFGGFGDLEDQFADMKVFDEHLDELYRDLRAKANGVFPSAGYHNVMLGPAMAGILAHEAIGE